MSHQCIGEVDPDSRYKTSHWKMVRLMVLLVAGLLAGGWRLSDLSSSYSSIAHVIRG